MYPDADPPRLRTGVVGLGVMGQVHILGLRASGAYDVVACADPGDHGSSIARNLGVDAFYETGDALLDACDLDVLTIAAPPSAHHPLVLAAAARGLPVICEKPFALDAEQAAAMVAATRAAGTTNALDHQMRFNGNRREIRRLVQDGYVGTPRTVAFRGTYPDVRGQGWTWWSTREAGGGILGEYGSHVVDLLRWIFGEVEEVSGRCDTFVDARTDQEGISRSVDSDDYAEFTLGLGHGVRANVLLSGVATDPTPVRELVIEGDAGRLLLDGHERLWGFRVTRTAPEEWTQPEPDASVLGRATDTYTQPFVRLARQFAAALDGGPFDPIPSFADGLAIQRVIDAVRAGSGNSLGGT